MKSPARDWRALWAFAASLVVCLVAISNRSLWIDELATAAQAMQPTLGSWWQTLLQEKTAHLQMPLYMLYIWGYEKLFGSSEWVLRSANLPWFLAGAVLFITSFPAEKRPWHLAAGLALFSPFAWYYLDEARPYGMEVGASLLVTGALRRLAQDIEGGLKGDGAYLTLFILGILALCGSSLLGMIWAGAALVALPVLLPRARLAGLLKGHPWLWLTAGTALLALAAFYLWTLKIGARATAPTTTSWGSMFFVGYEVLGFGGLGPSRLELRSAGLAALRGYAPWIGLYGAAIMIVIGAAWSRERKLKSRQHLILALLVALPAAFILGTGWVAHFRVLGRHFAPVIPVLLVVCISGLGVLWDQRRAWAKGVAVLFCGLTLVSCLSLRFSPRHEKDNYRAAADLARAALRGGQAVWWNAAPEGVRYYGVPVADQPGRAGEALLVLNPTPAMLAGWPTPKVVIASKPDLYDGTAALAAYLRERGFLPVRQMAAFVIWEKSGPEARGGGKSLCFGSVSAYSRRVQHLESCPPVSRAAAAGMT